ncbi:MAG: Pilus assembly protein PilO [Pseudomonadota bacterium]|jgi:Tfp pilus assembly protein PilO
MDNISAQYDQLPPIVKISAALIILAATGYTSWSEKIIPKQESLAEKTSQLEALTQKLKSISNSLESPLSLEEELAKANREFKKLLDLLPAEAAIERVLNDFASISRIAGTEIREFTPAGDSKSGDARSTEPKPPSTGTGNSSAAETSPDANTAKIAVKMNGSFSSIVSFIDQAMSLQRIVRIQDFEINNSETNLKLTQRPKLTFSGNFIAYFQKQAPDKISGTQPDSSNTAKTAPALSEKSSKSEDDSDDPGRKSMSAKGLMEEKK